jgi:hypothetical protein
MARVSRFATISRACEGSCVHLASVGGWVYGVGDSVGPVALENTYSISSVPDPLLPSTAKRLYNVNGTMKEPVFFPKSRAILRCVLLHKSGEAGVIRV